MRVECWIFSSLATVKSYAQMRLWELEYMLISGSRLLLLSATFPQMWLSPSRGSWNLHILHCWIFHCLNFSAAQPFLIASTTLFHSRDGTGCFQALWILIVAYWVTFQLSFTYSVVSNVLLDFLFPEQNLYYPDSHSLCHRNAISTLTSHLCFSLFLFLPFLFCGSRDEAGALCMLSNSLGFFILFCCWKGQ